MRIVTENNTQGRRIDLAATVIFGDVSVSYKAYRIRLNTGWTNGWLRIRRPEKYGREHQWPIGKFIVSWGGK